MTARMPTKNSKRPKPKTRAASKPKANSRTAIRVEMPVWYQPQAALGSAVRYVSSLSPKFNWVGIYLLKGKTLELGPYIGAKTEHIKIPVGKGVCGSAVSRNTDLNVPDVSKSDNYLACS